VEIWPSGRSIEIDIENSVNPGAPLEPEMTTMRNGNGHINGNVKGTPAADTFLSVSESGCIEGSVIAPSVILNGIVKGDIEAGDRVELGAKARVLGNVHYTLIETAVGAQINGKLIHRGVGAANSGTDRGGTGRNEKSEL